MPASRRPRSRRPVAAGRAPRSPARVAAGPSRGSFTTRAALLGLVLCGLVLSAAVPLREFLDQRADIRRLETAQAAQRERVAALQEEERRLRDPAHVRRLARERLHYVMPGETAYVVLRPAPDEPDDVVVPPAPAGTQAPWWSQLWSSVRAADRPQPVE
jgi:cell division protein FtsB